MIELYENISLGEKYYKANVGGLDVYVIPKKMSTVYASVAVNFGSSDTEFVCGERRMKLPAGTAHFLEHKMFENPDGTDVFEQFSLLGANANAYTAAARTCYLFSCTDNFAQSLRLLLSLVTKPHFTEASVEKERPIIASEIRMYKDDPYWKMHFGLLNCLYCNDPIRIDPAGTEESIASITPELLYECHRNFYMAENMALCVCGDVEPTEVCNIAAEFFAANDAVKPIRVRPDEPAEICSAEFRTVFDVATPLFALGIKCKPPKDAEEFMRAEAENEIILQAIFGKSGTFYNHCYESGVLGDCFSSGYSTEAGCAFVMIYGRSDEPDRVRELIMKELSDRAEHFCTADEFERAKKVCYSAALDTYNSTEETANAFLGFALDGGDLLRYTDYLRAADYEQVKARFKETYNLEKTAFSVISGEEAHGINNG